ncbi:vam6/Vps39-like protein [Cimex lectularius]|uniref:CNH domain-containing protein n=1 Tax=Cimex lectularius TaxID=79782 RepID=A0A8I6RCN4_CIMLE|nr:vam6/Vps39-like protein [Cimex lectularius]
MAENEAHTAYVAYPLPKITAQIECMDAFDDKLLIGTKQGHLLFYTITHGLNPKGELIRYCKTFSKKPISQIAAVGEFGIVIKLSDNIVSIHDLSATDFAPIKTLNKTKCATLFALDIQRNLSLTGEKSVTVRLCVVVKRKLQFYYWKNREFMDLTSDFVLNEVPRALAWTKERICIGTKAGYSFIKLPDTIKESCSMTGKQSEPLITKIRHNDEDFFSLGIEMKSAFVSSTNDEIMSTAVRWSDIPLNVGYDEPYMIGVLPNHVEIRCWNIDDYVEIKPLDISSKLICTASPGIVYLACNDQIWILQAEPYHKQIKLLLNNKKFELALKLANITNDTKTEKEENIRSIRSLYAKDLFHNKKYKKSMDEFLKLETDPYEVIKLFPELVQTGDSPSEEQPERDPQIYYALTEYLTAVRGKKETGNPDQHQSLMQIIDTTLLKCYLQTQDAIVAPLLRRNYCNLEEAERVLKKHEKYRELEILYKTKGLHEKALQLLKTQADIEDSPLRGLEPTVTYLQNLGKDHIELIFEFASWVLEVNPEEGLKIFTEDTPEVEALPRPKVLDYLLKTSKHNLIISYIEHAIYTWKETLHIFHNALIHQYRERIMTLGESDPLVKSYKQKLIKFMEFSQHYEPSSVLLMFPTNGMFEERALLNGKMNKHDIALGIYILVIGDYKRALQYCEKVYSEQRPGYEKVYIEVLKLLLHPPDSIPGIDPSSIKSSDVSDNLDFALTLLEAHPTEVAPSEAIHHLPDDLPLSKLKKFLMSSMSDIIKKRSNAQQLRGLLNAFRLQIRKEKLEYESQRIVVTDVMVCPVCKKRFGNQSAFVRYPNGQIVHYSCQDKMTDTLQAMA